MALNVEPTDPRHPGFVGVASGVDLRQADAGLRAEIEAAMDAYAVLVFPDQSFANDEQLAFSSLFGSLETSRSSVHPNHRHRFDTRLSDISNLNADGQMVATEDRRWLRSLANRLWHSDSSYKPTPAKYSMLSAHTVPSWGGETEFADMRAAYDALPDRTKARIEDMVALHSEAFSRAKVGFYDYAANEQELNKPVPQALVRIHPGSKRRNLFLASHAGEAFPSSSWTHDTRPVASTAASSCVLPSASPRPSPARTSGAPASASPGAQAAAGCRHFSVAASSPSSSSSSASFSPFPLPPVLFFPPPPPLPRFP